MNKQAHQSKIYFQTMLMPFGKAYLYADEHKLKALLFKPWKLISEEQLTAQPNSVLDKTKVQLKQYLLGERRAFDLPIGAEGTEFQHKVWKELCKIPFAETQNYGQIAENIGNKNASRAVGMANGKNPLSIIVPCHRVIGANGRLTGYAGGLKTKEWLLAHESSIAKTTNQS